MKKYFVKISGNQFDVECSRFYIDEHQNFIFLDEDESIKYVLTNVIYVIPA